jgi:hypothetical protein
MYIYLIVLYMNIVADLINALSGNGFVNTF